MLWACWLKASQPGQAHQAFNAEPWLHGCPAPQSPLLQLLEWENPEI